MKNNISEQIIQSTRQSSCLEEAAQKYTDILYDNFAGTIVLARLFATIPYGKLPGENQAFVDDLSQKNNIQNLIKDDTPVVSLLGTRGENNAWNDRKKSEGHVGIPMASSHFISEIPMMTALFEEIGLDLSLIDSKNLNIAQKTIKNRNSLFYVRDASVDKDNKGRKIIPAQDFVNKYNVKTMFGLGAGYFISNIYLLTIIFTRKIREREIVRKFLNLSEILKNESYEIVKNKKIFIQ